MANSNTQDEGKRVRHKRSAGRHLLLLMWKSLLLRRRHWLITLFEILLPTILFSLVLFLRLLPQSALLPVYHNETSIDPAKTEHDLQQEVCINYGVWYNKTNSCYITGTPGADIRVFYGPPGNFTRAVSERIIAKLDLPSSVLKEVNSNDEIDEMVKQSYFAVNKSQNPYYIGLFFNQDNADLPPEKLDYDLGITGTWNTDSLFPFMQAAGPGWSNQSYIEKGFALIQSLVDRFYISHLTGDSSYMDSYEYEVETYPYPPYYDDKGFSQLYGSFIPSYVVLSFLLLSPSLIKSVVHEKETGVRELIRLMGMNRWLMWGGWFLHGLMVVLIVVTIITIMITVGLPSESGWIPPILNYSDPFYVWVMLALYGISSVAFCLTIATLFSRPTLATTLGILIWLISYYLPNTFIYFRYDEEGLAVKLVACLLPNMAMTLGFRVLAMFEGRALGVQWNDLWSTGNPRDELTPALILIMLVVDIILYCLIIWYVDQISPGTYGVAAPWYFPFQKSYWCSPSPSESLKTEDISSERSQYFEEEPEGLKPGIVIRNLRKEFKSLCGMTKVAVENVSMTCYEGQCTVLLGHNGAGKTTTMSVLTGVFGATAGMAEVGGWNIATHLKEAREELGLCPQHNMLFVDLTVLQHLLFFGRLKGMTTKAAKEEALEVLQRLELLDKKDMFGNQLSGGMKRKLCLAISLIGGSKVVILDEPSSGLDPESRRWVWQVVQGERGRRTILVTTHHMEEADVLGDRVAIMASGSVVCAGSTLFLKNKFGDGYTLEMILKEGSDLNTITGEVQKHMSSASLHTQRGGEVSYKLPPNTSHFAPLLTSLTSNKEHFGISHIGLSLTTMEQVFLRVSEVMEEEEKMPEEKTNGSKIENVEIGSKQQLYGSEMNRVTGWKLLVEQIKAFFIKRAIYTKRKWGLFITQGLIPVAVTIMCLLVDQTIDFLTAQDPPLPLKLDLFPATDSFVEAATDLQGLADWYLNLPDFTDHHHVEQITNMTGSLLQAAKDDLPNYRESHICSASFLNGSKSILRVLSQTIPFHTTGIGTSLATNALLNFATGTQNNTITTTNRPLPPDTTWAFAAEFSTSTVVYANIMPLALAFLSASFLIFPLQERESNTKQVQLMTGAPVWGLWLTTFIWDMVAYLITLIIIVIFFVTLDPNGYFTMEGAPGALVVLLLLYGWGSIPMAYVFSFPFQTAASGFSILALVNIIAGQLLVAIVAVLKFVENPGTQLAGDILYWVASVIPSYPAAMGFSHLVETGVHNIKCDQFDENTTLSLCGYLIINAPNSDFMQCCPRPICDNVGEKICFEKWSYYRMDLDGMGPDLLSLFINGIIFFGLVAFIEYGGGRILREAWFTVTCKMRRFKVMSYPGQVNIMEDDVAAETELVDRLMQNGISEDNNLLVHKLSKTYLGAIMPAVDNISFRVGRGECLGLLGVNGAGKTTTFKMLTGDEAPSNGDAMIEGLSLNKQRNKNIGYCPQFDAFLGDLTGIEMLQLMGRLRGLRGEQLQRMVMHLVKVVGMTECANRPSETYSGGNRRKLSTAMALIGEPALVFLDEPTSGVDPASRRRVWAAVSRAVSSGQSVVLTSHSMEECEALCSRIIIMSQGTLRCVGTTAHLKAKYGQGYSLQIKLKTHGFSSNKGLDEQEYIRKVDELQTSIAHHLSGSVITDQHRGMIAYRVPSSVGWGQLFTVMEALKNNHDPNTFKNLSTSPSTPPPSPPSTPYPPSTSPSIVEVYAASDTTLEQVFLSFAREAMETQSSGPQVPQPIPAKDLISSWVKEKGVTVVSENKMETEL